MFLGHFGVALAAKRLEPKVNLGAYILAAQCFDLIWPIFVILGLESVAPLGARQGMNTLNFVSYPYTHSLLGDLFWAALVAGLYYHYRHSLKAALVIFFVTISHWILDLFVHEPDLPLWPSDRSLKVGMTLWRSLPMTLALEFSFLCFGIFLYLQSKRDLSKTNFISLVALIVFLVGIYLLSVFSPPPPLETPAVEIAGPALLMWIFVWWGAKIDR